MNFLETIENLMKRTAIIYVYAMAAYNNGKCAIGTRASYYGDMNNDPVIDGNTFMISGDIYDCRHWQKVENMNALKSYIVSSKVRKYLRVRLHANPLFSMSTKIDLGDYEITDYEVEEVQQYTPFDASFERVRFDLKRIN